MRLQPRSAFWSCCFLPLSVRVGLLLLAFHWWEGPSHQEDNFICETGRWWSGCSRVLVAAAEMSRVPTPFRSHPATDGARHRSNPGWTRLRTEEGCCLHVVRWLASRPVKSPWGWRSSAGVRRELESIGRKRGGEQVLPLDGWTLT